MVREEVEVSVEDNVVDIEMKTKMENTETKTIPKETGIRERMKITKKTNNKMMKMVKIPEISLVSIEVANVEEVKEVEVEEAEDVVNKKTEMLVEENMMMRTGVYIINKMITAKLPIPVPKMVKMLAKFTMAQTKLEGVTVAVEVEDVEATRTKAIMMTITLKITKLRKMMVVKEDTRKSNITVEAMKEKQAIKVIDQRGTIKKGARRNIESKNLVKTGQTHPQASKRMSDTRTKIQVT